MRFEVPGPVEREQLWRKLLPYRAPTDGLPDYKGLAERYVLTGSEIRSACLAAARKAARRGGNEQVIRQADLEAAAKKAHKRKEPAVGFRGAPRATDGTGATDRTLRGGEVMSERDSGVSSIGDAIAMAVIIFAIVMFFIVVAIVTFLASPGMLVVGGAKLAFGLTHSGRQVWVLSIAASLTILIVLVLAFVVTSRRASPPTSAVRGDDDLVVGPDLRVRVQGGGSAGGGVLPGLHDQGGACGADSRLGISGENRRTAATVRRVQSEELQVGGPRGTFTGRGPARRSRLAVAGRAASGSHGDRQSRASASRSGFPSSAPT